MARRASSSAHPLWILITVALFLGALGGGFFLYKSVSDPYRTMAVLPVKDYLENSNSLRGNSYKLDGSITAHIDSAPGVGRLFSVGLGNGDIVAVMVPPEFNHINIERGQRYLFKLEVSDKGLLQAKDVKKTSSI